MDKYLFEMIGKRKSIRKFKDKALDSNSINEIKTIIGKLEPLYENRRQGFQRWSFQCQGSTIYSRIF